MEYAGKVWDPEKYPWQTVGKLVVPKQDSFNYELKSFWEDHMRIDPWLGLKTLQPLGSPNRLRKVGMSLHRKVALFFMSTHSLQSTLQAAICDV